MFDRVGKGIRSAPRDALIAASVDDSIRGKSFGFHRAMDHTGAVIGPVLAIIAIVILILYFGFTDMADILRMTFILAIIPGIFAILTIIFFVKEAAPKNAASKKFRFSLKNFDKNFKSYLLIMILFTLGNSSDAFLLFRVEESIRKSGAVVDFISGVGIFNSLIAGLGDTAAQAQIINILFLPFIWAFFHIIKVVFSTPLGSLSDRIGRKLVINIGWGIYAFVYLAFALLQFLPSGMQLIATFVLFAIYALFYAFSEGAEKAFVADLVGDENRGSAFGMFNFAIGLGALPASIIFGLLYSSFDAAYPGYGGMAAFGFGAVVAMISMFLLGIIVKEPGK
jgi:MFS family permease